MEAIKNAVKKVLFHITEKFGIGDLRRESAYLHDIQSADYIQKYLHNNPKYADPKRLNRFERNIYSQTGEDGILEEIFNRIGTTNRSFVEFGVSDGLENCTAYLLLKGWSGLWLEGSQDFYHKIQKNYKDAIDDGKLKVANEFISVENIEELFEKHGVSKELDLLSVDIDGNDYWIWKSISKYKPRVVAIECNAFFGPTVAWVQSYDPSWVWDRRSVFGASVHALELLGKEKGYTLVGVNFIGNESFFVRNDLVQDKFCAPYTASHHYEDFKVFLYRKYKYQKSYRGGHLIKK